MSAHKGKKKE